MPHSTDALAAAGGSSTLSVALVTDRPDWHARELTRALAGLGARAICVDLATCGFDAGTLSRLRIAGFLDRLPDAVLVRSMAGGSFEAVTLRLGILHALRETGVPVINDARAIERCVDKSTTSFLLARAGIATPATWAVESPELAAAIVRRETAAGPLVLKPLFGSQGRGLRLIRSEQDLPDPGAVKGVYYLQRYVAIEREGFRDFRLLVSQGRVVTAMMRHAASWITNIKRGGRPVAAVVDADMKALALAAAAAIGADFAGVDIVHDADGRPTVLEVNSMPAWSGLQKVTSANIAAVLAADLVTTLSARRKRGAAG
jgi:tetrahydromethanopterin:alpha-L-glutamate ligase